MSLVQSLQAIADPTHKVTMTELRVLSDIGSANGRQFWDAWQSITTARRREIVGRLVEIADDNVDLNFSTVLRLCLQDADAAVRARAAEGLWEDESIATLRQLLPLLDKDPAPEVRAAAAVTLSRFAYMAEMGELNEGDDASLRAGLLRTLNDTSQPGVVRRRALESAGYFAEEPSIQQAIEQSYRGESIQRESALVAMGRSMLPRWLPSISDSLRSQEPALRYQAARAAGEFAQDAEELLGNLLPLLDDEDSEVSLAAIWALGQIGGAEAKNALEQLSNRGDEAQRQAAGAALIELLLGDDPVGF